MNTSTQDYLKLLGGEDNTKLALLTCAAALRLDDEVARGAISLIVHQDGSINNLLYRIKNLGCVRKEWDGSWYIAEDVRRDFVKQLYQEVPESDLVRLRAYLKTYSAQRAESFSPDGQVTSYRVRQAKFESAFQEMLIPEQTENGAARLTELWIDLPTNSAQQATADSVDYLAGELPEYISQMPADVLFLQGMSARGKRGDEAKGKQLRYFGEVYRIALTKTSARGYIYGVAAHLYGKLLKDFNQTKTAFENSIDWYDSAHHRAQVYNSLGDHLSAHKDFWSQAENCFMESLNLRYDDSHQGQVYNSLGKLLSKDRNRWSEAIDAYRRSFNLRDNPIDKAMVLTSWADLLLKFNSAELDEEAKKFAEDSLRLDPDNPNTIGMSHRILAVIYERQGEYSKAVKSLKILLGTNKQLGKNSFRDEILERIAKLSNQE